MICPHCNKHRLLKAEGKWFCPLCFNIFHYLPLYGQSNRIFDTLSVNSKYGKIFKQPLLDSQGCVSS